MKSFPRFGVGRATVVAAVATALALAAFVPTFATGAPPPVGVTPPPGATVDTVFIKGGFHPGNLLRFVAPATAHTGDYLQVINKTKPHQVGPHTFSLVTQSSIPKTHHGRKVCFTKGHICKAIAKWHGAKGNGPVTENPTIAGGPGWDTLGSLTVKGDSWFTTNKPNTSIVQQLNVNTTAGPTRIYFQCAIHPFMHGSIEVLPPGP